MQDTDYAVVELSSFQLMDMKRSPARAVITNLAPNHLTLSNRLHLQSTIFISDMQRPSRHRNLDASSHFFLFERWRYRLG